jgi:hypothetical protein
MQIRIRNTDQMIRNIILRLFSKCSHTLIDRMHLNKVFAKTQWITRSASGDVGTEKTFRNILMKTVFEIITIIGKVQTQVHQHFWDFKSPVASLRFFKRGDFRSKIGKAYLPEFAARGVEFYLCTASRCADCIDTGISWVGWAYKSSTCDVMYRATAPPFLLWRSNLEILFGPSTAARPS